MRRRAFVRIDSLLRTFGIPLALWSVLALVGIATGQVPTDTPTDAGAPQADGAAGGLDGGAAECDGGTGSEVADVGADAPRRSLLTGAPSAEYGVREQPRPLTPTPLARRAAGVIRQRHLERYDQCRARIRSGAASCDLVGGPPFGSTLLLLGGRLPGWFLELRRRHETDYLRLVDPSNRLRYFVTSLTRPVFGLGNCCNGREQRAIRALASARVDDERIVVNVFAYVSNCGRDSCHCSGIKTVSDDRLQLGIPAAVLSLGAGPRIDETDPNRELCRRPCEAPGSRAE